uniref:Ornithine decarboxylase antizyme n=1 Tax=Paracoccidioides brasiliensis TaxID=121759 RepID=A7UAL0_PARBR|nr:ornithine decarboxylase antizyme [Paracoccidioides brasiliensis]
MAGISSSNQNNNSNHQQVFEWSRQTQVLASCYSVNPCTGSLSSFHYCTTVGTGAQWYPEVPSGHKFPPTSPPTKYSATAVVADEFLSPREGLEFNGEAVQTITEECERLFCDTLWTLFLGERQLAPQQSLVIGAVPNNNKHVSAFEANAKISGRIQNCIEVWDYPGDTIYRGFVAADGDRRTLFVFFDNHTCAGQGFKSGLMALFEIASSPELDCSEMIACVDRSMDAADLVVAMRNLGWVGFELSSLNDWVVPPLKEAIISGKWLFMTVEI